MTTNPSDIVYDVNRRHYEPSLDTNSDTKYEARISLSSYTLETKTEEHEIDSTANKVRKILGRYPDTEENTKIVQTCFKGILESPDSRTKEIVKQVDLQVQHYTRNLRPS